MKRFLLFTLLTFAGLTTFAQSVYPIEADIIRMKKRVSGNTLVDVIGGLQTTLPIKPGSDTTSSKQGFAMTADDPLFGNGSYFVKFQKYQPKYLATKADTLTGGWYDDGGYLVNQYNRGIFTPNWNFDETGNGTIRTLTTNSFYVAGQYGLGYGRFRFQSGTPMSTSGSSNLYVASDGRFKYLNGSGTIVYDLITDGDTLAFLKRKVDTSKQRLDSLALSTNYKVTTLYQIGDIYNKSTFADLSDFNTNTGYTVASSKINATGNNSYTSYLQLNKATALDKYSLTVSYKYTTSVPATDSGFRVGMNGINGTSCYVYVKPSTRKIYAYMTYGSTYYVSDSAFTVLSVGDSLVVQLDWSRGIATMTATNFTIGQTISQTLPSTWLSSPSVISGVISNTAYPTILAGAATYQVCSFKYSSDEFSQPVLAVAGNSITRGSYASSEFNRYASQIGGLVWAGPGDGTAQMILRLPELRDYVKPSILFLMIGGNDVGNGVDTNTIKTNYTRIVDSATSYGIQVYHLLPTPRTASDVSWLKDYLIRTYPTRYIDTWTPLIGSGTAMAAWFNSGDGIHPNAAGHTAIANRIKADTIYQRLVNQYGYNGILGFYKITPKSVTDTTPLATKTYVDYKLDTYVPNGLNGTNNVLPKYSGNGLTASTITDNGTFVNMQTSYLSLGSKLILSYGATTGGLSVNFNNGMRGDVALNFGYNSAKVRFDSTGHGYYAGNVYAVGTVISGNSTSATLNANTLGLGITTPLDILHAYKSSTSQVFGIIENPSSSGSVASSGIKFRVHTGSSSNDVGYIYSTGSSWSFDQSGANAMIFAGIGSGGVALASYNNINFFTGATGATTANRQLRIFTNGNILAQTGGTFTDNGAKWQVTGNATISGTLNVAGNVTVAGNALLASDITGGLGLNYNNSKTGNLDLYNGTTTLRSQLRAAGGLYLTNRAFLTSLVLNKDSVGIFNSSTVLSGIDTITGLAKKLEIGLANAILNVNVSGVPAWTSTPTLTSVTTADPTSGTGPAWQFGAYKAATVTLSTTNYVEVKIGGTIYKLAIVI